MNTVIALCLLCAWYLWSRLQTERRHAIELTRLRGSLRDARLATCRLQLNPHLLCNALNSVAALALKDTPAANRMLARLGDLLRATLAPDRPPLVSLAEEIAFIRRYVEIEQLRFGQRLQIEYETEPDALRAAVPDLILQPLVENAIKHAIAARTAGGHIVLRARRRCGQLELSVVDNGRGADPRSPDPGLAGRGGIGLRNTRQRLEGIYGSTQQFDLIHNERGGCTASVVIPFRPVAA